MGVVNEVYDALHRSKTGAERMVISFLFVFLFSVFLVVSANDLGLITDLFEALCNFLDVGFIGIVDNGHFLFLHIGFNFLDAFFKADVAFDFVFATYAVHDRIGGEYHDLDVFGYCCEKRQQKNRDEHYFLHIVEVVWVFVEVIAVRGRRAAVAR